MLAGVRLLSIVLELMDEITLWLNSPCSPLFLPFAIPYRIHICQSNNQNFRYQNDTKVFFFIADNGLTYIRFAGEQQKHIILAHVLHIVFNKKIFSATKKPTLEVA